MNEQVIHDYLKQNGLNEYAIAGLMGNLFAESGLNPKNLQNSYENILNMNDNAYVSAVDNGTYKNFAKDKAGFGLCQWTFITRKQALLNFARESGRSIGDLQMQLDFLWKELSESYPVVLTTLMTATSVRQASDSVLLDFERPANQSESVRKKRAEYGQKYFDLFSSYEDLSVDEFANLFNEMRNSLRDNDGSEYSNDARNWAVKTGLIIGSGNLPDGCPNYMWGDLVTREQFVTVLYRFTQIIKS